MNIYIPFNMIVDIDYGIIRLIEKLNNISEYPVNNLKSFLLNRKNENPIPEYCEIRKVDLPDELYDIILSKQYKYALPLSMPTDMIAFVINTYKLGLSNEVKITIGYNLDCEKQYLQSLFSTLKHPIAIDIIENREINLNDFDCIFTKYLDENYVNNLINNIGIHEKRIYVADYGFNTLYDTESEIKIVDPILHMRLESEGNVVCTVSLYNKK